MLRSLPSTDTNKMFVPAHSTETHTSAEIIKKQHIKYGLLSVRLSTSDILCGTKQRDWLLCDEERAFWLVGYLAGWLVEWILLSPSPTSR
jgi:hypothetical protein